MIQTLRSQGVGICVWLTKFPKIFQGFYIIWTVNFLISRKEKLIKLLKINYILIITFPCVQLFNFLLNFNKILIIFFLWRWINAEKNILIRYSLWNIDHFNKINFSGENAIRLNVILSIKCMPIFNLQILKRRKAFKDWFDNIFLSFATI